MDFTDPPLLAVLSSWVLGGWVVSSLSRLGFDNPVAVRRPAARPSQCRACNPCEVCPVRDLSVCGAFEPEELHRLDAIVTRMRLKSEQAVFYEWDTADHVFNVTEGVVRLSKLLPDGRRQITGFLFPGDFLGIAYAETYAYSAEAICPVALCRFQRRQLEGLCDEFPELEKRILGMASNELVEAQEQILMLGRKTAQEKLASFLCRLSNASSDPERPIKSIDLPMNRTDIADYLGLTTETVSRSFSHLAKQGVLELASAQRVILRQPERLVELAEGNT